MIHGSLDRQRSRRRLLVGTVALTVVTALPACTAAERNDTSAAETAAPQHLGPAGYGKLTITMTEAEALATGDLHDAPVSTVQGWSFYSFVNGPKPDPVQIAADGKLEEELKAAEKANQVRFLELRATSMRRTATRMTAFLTAGGASFKGGRIDTIAAPKEAVTEAGIKRGSTVAELKAAYQGKGLTAASEYLYRLPVEGHPRWVLQFETERGAVKFMVLDYQAEE